MHLLGSSKSASKQAESSEESHYGVSVRESNGKVNGNFSKKLAAERAIAKSKEVSI